MLLITSNISRVMMKMILVVNKKRVRSLHPQMISCQEEVAEDFTLKLLNLQQRGVQGDQDARYQVRMREVMMKKM